MARNRTKEQTAFEKAIEAKKQEAIRLAEEAYRRALEEARATAAKEAAVSYLHDLMEGRSEYEKPETIGDLVAIIRDSGAEEAIFALPLSYLQPRRENNSVTQPSVEVSMEEMDRVRKAITGVKCTLGAIRKKTGMDNLKIHACMQKMGAQSEGARRSKVYWL